MSTWWKVGFEDGRNSESAKLPTKRGYSTGEHLMLNLLLPGIGTLISAADAMDSADDDDDVEYMKGYAAGVLASHND